MVVTGRGVVRPQEVEYPGRTYHIWWREGSQAGKPDSIFRTLVCVCVCVCVRACVRENKSIYLFYVCSHNIIIDNFNLIFYQHGGTKATPTDACMVKTTFF